MLIQKELDLIYDKLIKKELGNIKPSVEYVFPQKSQTLKIQDSDFKAFKKLYNITGGNQSIGYGEVALFWLFRTQLSVCEDVDLKYKSRKIDVKSYPKSGFITLGKWKDNLEIRKLITSIFSCYNLLNAGSIGEFKSELNFTTSHLKEALEDAINLNLTFNKMALKKENNISSINKTFNYLNSKFKTLATDRGRVFIENIDNVDIIVEESISDIIYNIVDFKLFKSNSGIGKYGYIINVSKENNDILNEIEIYKVKDISKNTQILQSNFSVVSGEIKIKPAILDLV